MNDFVTPNQELCFLHYTLTDLVLYVFTVGIGWIQMRTVLEFDPNGQTGINPGVPPSAW